MRCNYTKHLHELRSGEALSIREMVAAMQSLHGTNPDRVFVTGLSAGGAMAAVMLATYPEISAGGAVIAGLPFRIANSVPEAFDRMRGLGARPDLSNLVRSRVTIQVLGPRFPCGTAVQIKRWHPRTGLLSSSNGAGSMESRSGRAGQN